MGHRLKVLGAVAAVVVCLPAMTSAVALAAPTHHVTGIIIGNPRSTAFVVEVTGDVSQTFVHVSSQFSVDLPDGTYFLRFMGSLEVEESWDDAPERRDATPIVVDGGDIDLGVIDLAPMAWVTGRLSAPADNFVGYDVVAYPADDYTGRRIEGDTWGGFKVKLPAGDWKLRFLDTEGTFASEWYGDSSSFRDAAVIHVGTDDINLDTTHVTAGGSLTGFVRDQTGAAVRKLSVSAVNPDGEPLRIAGSSDSGRFVLDGLPPGPYTLQVSDDSKVGHLFPTTYYPATQQADDAEVVHLDEDATRAQDITVPRSLWGPPPTGRVVAGRVTDTKGQPVQGVYVGTVEGCDDYYDAFNSYFGSTVTDSDGRYAMTVTSESLTSVRIGVSDRLTQRRSTGGVDGYDYSTGYYAGATCETVPSVPVGTLDADVTLTQKGGMSGGISSIEGSTEIAGKVYIYPDGPAQRGEGDDFDPQPYRFSGSMDDLHRTFETAALPAGRYRVRFDGLGGLSGWWPEANSWATAGTVEVRPGETTPDILGVLRHRLVQRTAPYIIGWAKVGNPLSSYAGWWTTWHPTTYDYAWLRDGGVVGTGRSYTPVGADVGHALTFRVTVSDGVDTVVATSVPSPPVVSDAPPPTGEPSPTPTPTPTPTPAPPSAAPVVRPVLHVDHVVRSPATGHRSRIRLVVMVEGSGGPVTDGAVTVTEVGHRERTVPLDGGRAVLVVKRARPGRHTYVISYAGTSDTLPGSATVTVRVPRRHRVDTG